MAFLRAPVQSFPPFLEADAERFLRDQGFLPATPEESSMAQEAVADLHTKIVQQLAAA